MRRWLRSARWPAVAVAVIAGSAVAFGIAFAAPGRQVATATTTTTIGFSCSERPARPDVVVGPGDARVVASLAVLRRPATPADVPSRQAVRLAFSGRGLHLGAARLLRSGAEGRAWIVPVDDVRPAPLPERCIERAPREQRAALRRERHVYATQPAQPGVMVLTDGRVDVAVSSASLDAILSGHAVGENSCTGPSHDMLGVDALLADGATQPFLRFGDGHTILGDLHDNAVTFLFAKPADRAGLPTALAWSDATGREHTLRLPGGGLALTHCAALPRYVFSEPATGPGGIEATARGEVDNSTLDALAVKVRATGTGICPTIGLKTPDGLGRHVTTYCVARTLIDHDRFFALGQRSPRIGNRALLVGVADPKRVRWIEVETPGSAFLVRPSASGAFFVAYPDSQPRGRAWRLRAGLRGRTPIPFTAYRTITLPPTETGVRPPGASRTINRLLLARFAVFRRPRRASDALPHSRGRAVFAHGDANPLLSRFLGTHYGTRFYAVPGNHDLCLVTIGHADSGGASGCGSAAINSNPATPAGGWSAFRGGILVHVFLPDGIDHINVQRNDGTSYQAPVNNNLAVTRSTRALHRIWWTTPEGRNFSLPGISHTGIP